ncbi:MAG TPA: ricin-type beta-trefoil lectin domain protein [Gemmatimonadaceae bacterium]|nr:ricin-type beta-trefoil lectin domain protein [Gemmatimonadaceae bacterium]
MRIRRSFAALAAAAIVGVSLAACNDSPTQPKPLTPSLHPVVVTAATTLGTGPIASHNAAGKCIDASRGSATVSVAALLEPCGTAVGQQFTWQSTGNVSTFGGTMCLTDKGAKGLTYDPIIIYPCRSTAAQHWTLNSAGEIVGINGKCLSVLHAATASGSAIILYPCANGPSQHWIANGSSSATSALTVAISSGDNQVATYGAAVAKPLVVIVHKSGGAIASGATVTWKATDGTVSAASSVTNAAGVAQVTFKVSPTFFISKATATAGGQSVTFTATGNGTPDLQGRKIFPASSPWNTDISSAPVDPNSAALIASCGAGNQLHPDFGTVYHGAPNGIPMIVVHSTQPRVPITFRYAPQSDPGPYPLPPNTPIQGGLSSTGDRHTLVVDWEDWKSYEVFSAFPQSGGTSWKAGSGAIFNLTTGTKRPAGWTSADAAGTPMVPELVRYDEAVLRKLISHALHMSCNKTRDAYVAPATHAAGDGTSTNLPPMGMRVRLKKTVNISGFSATNQVILRALQHYGAFVADDGVGFMLGGVPDPRWNDTDLHQLTKLTSSSFEVVKMGPATVEK